MASILIRQVDEQTKTRLRMSAARHGRSMEEEARAILRGALATGKAHERNLAASIRRRFASLGGVELPEPVREPMRRPPHFGR